MCIGKVHQRHEEILSSEVLRAPMKKIKYSEDILSVSTRHTKTVLYTIEDLNRKFVDSTFYRILTKTTQPAHLYTAFSVLTLAYLLQPNDEKVVQPVSPLINLVYLSSFSAHFGAQIWMTFVSGLALYFNLPRHTFGEVQKVLFPKYFLMNAGLSLINLVIFLRTNNNNWKTTEVLVQAIVMSICFLLELVIRLYLTPPLLLLIDEKNKIEKGAGVGSEVGKVNPGKLKRNQKYLKVHKKFRKIHMIIAIGNVFAMACTMWHLYYLSQKITLT